MNLKTVLLRGVLVGVVASTVLLSGGGAQAQTEEQKEKAKDHFTKARRFYDVGRYQDAIDEYQKAYLNVEDPVFLYNIAQAYRLNDDPENAIRFYKNYLRRAPNAPNRDEVDGKIAELQKALDAGVKPPLPPPDKTAPPPPDTTTSPPPPDATTPPPPDTTTNTTGTDVGVSATASPPSGGSNRRMAGIILVGSGGVFVAIAALAGSKASSKASELEKATVFDPEIEKSGKAWNSVAIVTGVVGVLAAGVGLYLLVTDKSGTESDSSAPVAKTQGHQLAVFPTVAPGFAGAGASLTF